MEPLHPQGEPKWHKWTGASCEPGEEVDVSVALTAPVNTGVYEAAWRLCCSSPEKGFKKFGMLLPLSLKVVPNESETNLSQDSNVLDSRSETSVQSTFPWE